MSDTQTSSPTTEPGPLTTPVRVAAGAACCTSGGALVVHILTGSPLWLALAAIGIVASVALALTVASAGAAVSPWPALRSLVGRGALVGLVGTAVYDGSRWLLVQVGGLELSPFEALPLFGQALLGAERTGLAVEAAGVGYHVLNGVAFGAAYLVWFGRRRWWWGIVFALGLEAFMLGLYPGWLDPRSVAELTQVSMVGHLAYGTALGLTARFLYPDAGGHRASGPTPGQGPAGHRATADG